MISYDEYKRDLRARGSMITKSMIQAGYEQDVVKLIESPHWDGVVCQIGDNWFYFGGHTAEEYGSVEEYKRDIPAETIIDEIYDVLDEFSREPDFWMEYDYYEAYLLENLLK